MSSLADKTKAAHEKYSKLTEGRELSLQKSDWMFNQVIRRDKHFILYSVQNRIEPLYEVPKEKLLASWKHSSVVRLYKLGSDDKKLTELLDSFDIRKKLNANDECPSIIKFFDQGLVYWNDSVYYAVRYEDPNRTFKHWVTVDHQGYNIDAFDVFRLFMNALRTFIYLEKEGHVLTQFDENNYYVGSFQEDRVNFFRVVFKGHKKTDGPFDLSKRHIFSAPESSAANLGDLYKAYVFSTGLMAIWAIFTTNQKEAEFPKDVYQHTDKIEGLIKQAVELLYKENHEHKENFRVFLEEALKVKAEDRPNAKTLFDFAWHEAYDKLDYIEFKKEEEECLKSFQEKEEE